MKEKILVMGACGMVGGELVQALREKHGGENVIASDIREESPVFKGTGPYVVLDALDALATKNLVKKDTIIMCIQNGLGSEEIVKKIIKGKCPVLRGVTNFGAAFLEDGIIDYNNYGYTAVEKSPASGEIAENFTKCGLNAYVSKNIKEDVWKKLILNCVLNPITAILRIRNGGIADENLNPLKKLIVDECLKVAEKDGVKFDFDFLKSLNEGIKNSKNISSMQQDLLKGRKTEIDFLNLAVAELGKKYGIKCPVNDSLAVIIKEMERLNEKTAPNFQLLNCKRR